ncbi:MAG: GUN4 domain-containing protein [Leptolyngbyaceae cyanobacterium]
MFDFLRNRFQALRYKLILLSVCTTSILLIFSWLASTNPYLLENLAWVFQRPSDQAIIESLPSARNIDYHALESLLQGEQWEAADQETQKVLANILSLPTIRPDIRALLWPQEKNRAKVIRKIPCTDLLTIDRLWVNFSNRLFGFSIQREIVENDGTLPSPEEIRNVCVKRCNRELPVPRDPMVGRTLENTRCKLGCESLSVEAEFERIPKAVGRGQDRSKSFSQLPAGYYPSPVEVIIDREANVYRELAQRAAQCNI